jgi:lipoprotein signal peptidase
MTQTRVGTPMPQVARRDAVSKAGSSQGLVALGLLAAVVVVDQATKWWGWRHVPGATINPGTTWALWHTVNGWYSGPVTGALLDLLDVGLLSLAVGALVRRERPVRVLVSGALMIGGWSSNLLDRLGMHSVTAPGSDRGAIDFIPTGRLCWNVADVVICGATAVFLGAVYVLGRRSSRGVTPQLSAGQQTPRRPAVRRRERAWTATVGPVVAAALGADVPVGAAADLGVA